MPLGNKTKREKMRGKIFLINFSLLLILVGCNRSYEFKTTSANNTVKYPDNKWYKDSAIVDEGWDASKLKDADNYARQIGTAAYMVIYKGVVIHSYGDIQRKYWIHSIWKALERAIVGVYITNGIIDTTKTLKQLQIDDKPKLTEQEKTATVADIIRMRSGIVHNAAAENKQMRESKPKRDEYNPGEKYFYNNWDANVLETIVSKETKKGFYENFSQMISRPIEMESFDKSDVIYQYDLESSGIPSVRVKMSTVDLARFGLLILNGGKWKDKQIIPQQWVEQCLKPQARIESGEVGLFWLRVTIGPFRYIRMYSADGYGGHQLNIFPDNDLIFIHRANTFNKENYILDVTKIVGLMYRIFDAKRDIFPEEFFKAINNEGVDSIKELTKGMVKRERKELGLDKEK
jgi:hypothetical protein